MTRNSWDDLDERPEPEDGPLRPGVDPLSVIDYAPMTRCEKLADLLEQGRKGRDPWSLAIEATDVMDTLPLCDDPDCWECRREP